MNGAETLIKFLQDKGVDVAFGYPGGPVLVLYEAIYNLKFPHILTRHEQGAVHAAEGYARVTGRPGVVFATSGPGATNLVTGLADAMLDSVPVFAITGAVARKDTGRDAFQEADITGITEPITKGNYLVMDEKRFLPILEEAWALTTEGRPGPVLINIPKDILASEIPEEQIPLRAFRRVEPPASQRLTQDTKVLPYLLKAERPLLMVGGGCNISKGAPEALAELLELFPIPTASTSMGLGVLDSRKEPYLGFAGMHGSLQANEAVDQCDLLIAVGCRFSDRIIGDPLKYRETERTIIHCDIDASEINKNVAVDIGIEEDAADFFRSLKQHIELFREQEPEYFNEMIERLEPWSTHLAEKREKMNAVIEKNFMREQVPLLPEYVTRKIAERFAGKDPIVVTDVGQHQMFAAQHFPVESPRSFLTSGGLGTMGFGLPAAVGAAFAAEGRPVAALVGDGGFQMVIQELGTVAKQKLPIKIFIYDNSTLGMVRQWQHLFFHQHYSHSDLDNNPDFVKIAEAYGIDGMNVRTAEELRRALDLMEECDGPFVCRLFVSKDENVYPMIPAGKNPDTIIMPGLDE